jgi:hypothetical protein
MTNMLILLSMAQLRQDMMTLQITSGNERRSLDIVVVSVPHGDVITHDVSHV